MGVAQMELVMLLQVEAVVPEEVVEMLLVREQNPDLDIRLVFSNANQRLYKGSKTTYGMWADKHDFVWANKWIPEPWFAEGDEDGEAKPDNEDS